MAASYAQDLDSLWTYGVRHRAFPSLAKLWFQPISPLNSLEVLGVGVGVVRDRRR